MQTKIKEILSNISKQTLIYILGGAGILLVLLSSLGGNSNNETDVTEPVKPDYCTHLEVKLESILPEIVSVGKVRVMITAKNYGSVSLAKDISGEKEQTVVLNKKGGGEDARVIEEAYPAIQGVIIVADGGRSDKVKSDLTEAVVALLGIDAHKIKVFERNEK